MTFDVSRLYSLKPEHIGTWYVESLTAYIARLAEAHCVSTGKLLDKEVVPLLSKPYLTNYAIEGGSGFYNWSQMLNGKGKAAEAFINVLKELTGQNYLQLLTLVNWKNVLSDRGLLKVERAWCPMCLNEWRIQGNVISEPLLWALDIVKKCPQHHIELFIACPNCGRKMTLLDRNTRNGHCSWCHKWLGLDTLTRGEITPEEQKIYSLLSGMIMSVQQITSIPLRQTVALAIAYHVDRWCHGNVAEFARKIQVPKSTAWGWYSGKNLPQILAVVKLCMALNIEIADILDCKSAVIISSGKTSNRSTMKVREKDKPRGYRWIVMENEMDNFIAQLKEGTSLATIASELGTNRQALYHHFPEKCRLLSAKRMLQVHQKKTDRVMAECTLIHSTVKHLISQGIYPSRRIVEMTAAKPALLKNLIVKTVWKCLLKNLVLNRNTSGCKLQ